MAFTAAAIGVPIVASAIGGLISGKNQQSAAQQAQQVSQQQITDATQSAQTGAGQADQNLLSTEYGYNGQPGLLDNLGTGYDTSTDALTQGYGAAQGAVGSAGALGADALTSGQGQSLSDLYGGASQATNTLSGTQGNVDTALNSGLGAAQGALASRSSNAQDLLDQSGGLYGNYTASPGYASELAQGEQAIDRQNAAGGGRYSGAALKEATQYATNLTNQDYQNYVTDQNSLLSGSQAVDNNSLSANSTLAGLYGNAGSQSASTAAGLGTTAAGLQATTGSQAAGIDSNAAGSLASLYGNTGAQEAGLDTGAGSALASNASNYYGNINNVESGTASATNAANLNAANAPANMLGANIQNNQSTIPYAGSTAAAVGNAANTAGQAALLSTVYGSGTAAAPSTASYFGADNLGATMDPFAAGA